MSEDQLPIVLVASGTATDASDSYHRIESACRQSFPGHPVHWAYSSRAIRRHIQDRTGKAPATPAGVLDRLHRAGCRKAVVQSLHLLCGIEFHHLVWQAARSPLQIHLGLPLLANPEDFDDVLGWIDAVKPSASDAALVLVGHGTAHPAWTTYALLSRMVTARFGHQVLLGLIKGDPTPSAIASRLLAAGCRRVALRPFMLVAGAHFMQDIAGERSSSWQAQLARQGLSVTPKAEGLGAHPATINIFVRHIRNALNSPPLHLD